MLKMPLNSNWLLVRLLYVCDRIFSQLLSLSFTAYFEKDVSWNVVIKVDRKASDLRVNVKAQGYAISCQLTCEDAAVGDKQLMSASVVNDISLGRVRPTLTFTTNTALVLYLNVRFEVRIHGSSFSHNLEVAYDWVIFLFGL